jgi:hypothetical protein
MISQVQRGVNDTDANHPFETRGSGCFTSRKDPVPVVQNAEWGGLKGTENATPSGLDPWNLQSAQSERYSYTGQDKSLGLQQVEATRICRHSPHARVRFAIPTLRF